MQSYHERGGEMMGVAGVLITTLGAAMLAGAPEFAHYIDGTDAKDAVSAWALAGGFVGFMGWIMAGTGVAYARIGRDA